MSTHKPATRPYLGRLLELQGQMTDLLCECVAHLVELRDSVSYRETIAPELLDELGDALVLEARVTTSVLQRIAAVNRSIAITEQIRVSVHTRLSSARRLPTRG